MAPLGSPPDNTFDKMEHMLVLVTAPEYAGAFLNFTVAASEQVWEHRRLVGHILIELGLLTRQSPVLFVQCQSSTISKKMPDGA